MLLVPALKRTERSVEAGGKKINKKQLAVAAERNQKKNQRQVTLFPEHQKKKKEISEVITLACFIAPLNKSRPSPGYILARCIPC